MLHSHSRGLRADRSIGDTSTTAGRTQRLLRRPRICRTPRSTVPSVGSSCAHPSEVARIVVRSARFVHRVHHTGGVMLPSRSTTLRTPTCRLVLLAPRVALACAVVPSARCRRTLPATLGRARRRNRRMVVLLVVLTECLRSPERKAAVTPPFIAHHRDPPFEQLSIRD